MEDEERDSLEAEDYQVEPWRPASRVNRNRRRPVLILDVMLLWQAKACDDEVAAGIRNVDGARHNLAALKPAPTFSRRPAGKRIRRARFAASPASLPCLPPPA